MTPTAHLLPQLPFRGHKKVRSYYSDAQFSQIFFPSYPAGIEANPATMSNWTDEDGNQRDRGASKMGQRCGK